MADPTVVTAGVVAGIVICSLLFLIVVALVAYNVYLCRRRQAANKQHRQRLINRQWHIDNGWRPRDVLYPVHNDGFRGSGNVNHAYQGSTVSMSSRTNGRSGNPNPGYRGSTISMASRGTSRSGVGLAPRAQYEDDHISEDECDVAVPSASNINRNLNKPQRPVLRGSGFGATGLNHNRGHRPIEIHAPGVGSQNHPLPPRYSDVVATPAQSHYDNDLSNVVAAPRPEVMLHPRQLAAQWDRKPLPAMFSQQRHSADGKRTSCLAVLSAEAANLRASDVGMCDISLTGCGAQSVPHLGLVPPSMCGVLNGGLQYNQY